jgi:hypothetical protein
VVADAQDHVPLHGRDVVGRGGDLPRGGAGSCEHRAPGAALRAKAPAGVVQTPRRKRMITRLRPSGFHGARARGDVSDRAVVLGLRVAVLSGRDPG